MVNRDQDLSGRVVWIDLNPLLGKIEIPEEGENVFAVRILSDSAEEGAGSPKCANVAGNIKGCTSRTFFISKVIKEDFPEGKR